MIRLTTFLLLLMSIPAMGMKIKYPGETAIEVKLLSANEVQEILTKKSGKVDVAAKFLKYQISKTYELNTGQIILEFYDRRGVLINSRSDYQRLSAKDLRFIKNQIWYLLPRISYHFNLGLTETKQLIQQYKGVRLKKYEVKDDFFNYEVFRLSNQQIMLKLDSSGVLYEDIEALAFNFPPVKRVLYPKEGESGRKEFFQGQLPRSLGLNIANYHIYSKELDALLKVHQLSAVKKNIKLSHFRSILYKSKKGYYILIEDFDQYVPHLKRNLDFGTLYIFYTYKEFEKTRNEMLAFRKKMEDNPALTRGVSIFKPTSDRYGKDFPKYTMDEIKKLPKILNFNTADLGFTKKCLDIMNTSIRWNSDSNKVYDDMIVPLVAYIGEYNRKKGTLDWKMTYDKKDKTWEISLVDKKGEKPFDVIDIYKAFQGSEYGIPAIQLFIE